METTDCNDISISVDRIKAVSEIFYDQRVTSRDTIRMTRSQDDSETIHVIVLIAHTQQVSFVLEIGVHVETKNILYLSILI